MFGTRGGACGEDGPATPGTGKTQSQATYSFGVGRVAMLLRAVDAGSGSFVRSFGYAVRRLGYPPGVS